MGQIATLLELAPLAQESFLRLADYVIDVIKPWRVWSSCQNQTSLSGVEVHPAFVFDIPLSGRKRVTISKDNSLQYLELIPGDVLMSPPFAWKLPAWDLSHELMCFVYTAECIRFTYVDILTDQKSTPRCTNFYHTRLPPNETIHRLLHCLEDEATHNDPAHAIPDLLIALLRLSRQQLAKDEITVVGKAQATYIKLRQYMQENFQRDLDRNELAQNFGLNPEYVSRLLARHTPGGFTGLITELRMGHAAQLLRHTELSVGEITLRCGYHSVTFFTSRFKQHYGLPPASFRQRESVSF